VDPFSRYLIPPATSPLLCAIYPLCVLVFSAHDGIDGQLAITTSLYVFHKQLSYRVKLLPIDSYYRHGIFSRNPPGLLDAGGTLAYGVDYRDRCTTGKQLLKKPGLSLVLLCSRVHRFFLAIKPLRIKDDPRPFRGYALTVSLMSEAGRGFYCFLDEFEQIPDSEWFVDNYRYDGCPSSDRAYVLLSMP